MKENRKRLKKEEYKAIGEKCCNCGTTDNVEYHHVIPLNLGGKDVRTNMVCLCQKCHDLIHGMQREGGHKESIKRGIEKARSMGKKLGGRTADIVNEPQRFEQLFMQHLYEGLTVVEMQKILKVGTTTIYKYMRKLRNDTRFIRPVDEKIQRSAKYPKLTGKENEFDELYHQYLDKNITIIEIAAKFDVSVGTIQYHIRKKLREKQCQGLTSDNLIASRKNKIASNQEKFNELYSLYVTGKISINKMADILDVSPSTVKHHISKRQNPKISLLLYEAEEEIKTQAPMFGRWPKIFITSQIPNSPKRKKECLLLWKSHQMSFKFFSVNIKRTKYHAQKYKKQCMYRVQP
jgi:transposase